MRAVGHQAKTVYGSLQLCAGLETSIEGVNHAVAQRRQDIITQARRERADKESEEGSSAGIEKF